MSNAALITSEKKHEYPILIIDKKGILGESLAHELKNESVVILVSGKIINAHENILHIPFVKKFPQIPDNKYSHIFFIDEDFMLSKNIIKPFIKKTKNDNSSLILALNKESVDNAFLEKIVNSYEKIKIVLMGDIFSKNEIYNPNTQVNKFIYQAKIKSTIEVPGDGGEETQPIALEDAIAGILEAAFSQEQNYKYYYLFPKHKITLLMLAHAFQKKNPEIKISFIDEKKPNKEKKPVIIEEGKRLLSDNYNLSDRLRKIDINNLKIGDNFEQRQRINGQNKSFNFSFIFIFFISFLLLPLVTSLAFSFIGFSFLYTTKGAFEKNNFTFAKSSAQFSFESFNVAKKSLGILKEEVNFIGQKGKVEEFEKKIDLGIDASLAMASFVSAAEKYKKILSSSSKNPHREFLEAQTELKNALYLYGKDKQSQIIPDFIKNKLKNTINIISATIDFWPEILGFNGQKTYLILFQNNMELRPGGGFIGSYGILTLEQGKVLSFKIYDVYDADGQLKTHVEPPFPIRRFLPSVHWYLRDSNFSPDFAKGAVASAIFLNSEMHQAVDGVIGVDLFFIKNLLSVTGPIYVADYKENVNADNFYQITQTHTEKDFFPGSTQKKDFLRSFYNALIARLTSDKELSHLKLLSSFSTSVYEKHIMFAFNNPNTQATFAINGFSSSLFDERKKENGVINDFMGISEANLGANKVNYFVTRSITQKVIITDNGTVSEELVIAFKNTGKTDIYKNYLRILLPTETKLTKILVDGKEQKIIDAIDDPVIYEKKDFKQPSGLEVNEENQAQNSLFGFLININPQELKTIQVFYDLSEKLVLEKSEFSYSLKLFKQPGIDFYPYSFSLNYPESFNVIQNNNETSVLENSVTFSSQMTEDTQLKIDFAAK